MGWSEESSEIQETKPWCIILASLISVGLLVIAPCCCYNSRPNPAATTQQQQPEEPQLVQNESNGHAPARSRRRRRGHHHAGAAGGPRHHGDIDDGDSATSSSQFASVVDHHGAARTTTQTEDYYGIEMRLRTIPAPPRSAIATARRSQLVEQQQQHNHTTTQGTTDATATTPTTRQQQPLVVALNSTSRNSNVKQMSEAAGSVLYEVETELNTVEQEEQQQMNNARRRRQQPHRRPLPPPPRSQLSSFRQQQQHDQHRHGQNTTRQFLDDEDQYEVEYDVDGEQEEEEIEYDVDGDGDGLYVDDDDDISVMPPLHSDQVVPEDAADAYDVGVTFPTLLNPYINHPASIPKPTATSSTFEQWGELLLDIANPFFETRHVLNRAIPDTLSQHLVPPLQQVCLALVIAKLINTESALAYSVVELLFRCTVDDVSEAISDAQKTKMQHNVITVLELNHQPQIHGNTLQLAILLQGILVLPMLIVWRFGMNGTTQWLLGDVVLSNIAKQYTSVLIWERLVRGMLRGFLLPFRWMIQYESSAFDLMVFAALLVMVVILIKKPGVSPNLTTVAYVQLVATILTGIVKTYYVVSHGWFQPYRLGMWERIMVLVRREQCFRRGFAFLTN
jgi:hypothetical protein